MGRLDVLLVGADEAVRLDLRVAGAVVGQDLPDEHCMTTVGLVVYELILSVSFQR